VFKSPKLRSKREWDHYESVRLCKNERSNSDAPRPICDRKRLV